MDNRFIAFLQKRAEKDDFREIINNLDNIELENEVEIYAEALSLSSVKLTPKWLTCKNCDCGEFPMSRCDCSCHD